ncbi:MAG: NHL repeat-containing protein [Terracidiphilus sp.]|jgi:streptogramin lyase
MVNVHRILVVLAATSTVAALAGCGGKLTSSGGGGGSGGCTAASSSATQSACPALVSQAGVPISGTVMAGNQPVSGAMVQLYAAGSNGNGSPAVELLAAAVPTGTSGAFAVPGGYSCPSAQTPIYLLSKGGQSGAGSAANASLWLMTALGSCGNIAAGSNFVLNEVTTAASVWALASFMSAGGNVGASCTNTSGLVNAFLNANDLVNVNTGASPGAGIPATLTVSTSKLNSLANALASCTLSSGGSSCSELFSAAAAGSAVPGNTVDAALNIARAPGNHVSGVYALAANSPVFSPALTAVPPDFMLHNTVNGGGMASPASVSVGASGDVWVSSYFDTVSNFSPGGAASFASGITGSGINQSYGMALDATGDVWIANEQTDLNTGNGDVAELSSAGAVLESGLTGGGIDFPIAVAADPNGNMWFADYGDSKVTVLNGTGSAVSSSTGWGSNSLAFPVALAVDSNHNAWVANQGGLLPITKISADGSQVTNYDCDCNGASGIAVDQKENIWVANYYGNSISEVNSCGTLVLDAVTGGGVDHPQGIAVDGGGTVWVTNFLSNSISEINGASSSAAGTFVSPSTGFGTDASILQPYGLAVDASGSLWVSNFGNSTLTQFIGVAAPVKTPMTGPPQQP